MNNPLNALSQSIACRLFESRQHRAAEERQTFPKLALANADVYQRFHTAKKVPPPLPEKIRQAISRFRSNQSLTRQEWRLVLSGLAYTEDGSGILLEDTTLFARVLEQLRGSKNADSFRRREWFSLCYSYFGYAGENPQQNPQWLSLRREIVDGYAVICSQERREKEWMRVVNSNKELFTDNAGTQLGAQLFESPWVSWRPQLLRE